MTGDINRVVDDAAGVIAADNRFIKIRSRYDMGRTR